MTDEKVSMTMERRQFFKTLALLAGAAAVSPKVLGVLGEVPTPLASAAITYGDFVDAVAFLEEAAVGAPYYVTMHPELFAWLMEGWDVYLRGEFGKQMAMAEDVMVLQEIWPNQATYINAKTKQVMGIEIVFSEDMPKDEARIVWTTIAEDATLTIGIEEADEVFDHALEQ